MAKRKAPPRVLVELVAAKLESDLVEGERMAAEIRSLIGIEIGGDRRQRRKPKAPTFTEQLARARDEPVKAGRNMDMVVASTGQVIRYRLSDTDRKKRKAMDARRTRRGRMRAR